MSVNLKKHPPQLLHVGRDPLWGEGAGVSDIGGEYAHHAAAALIIGSEAEIDRWFSESVLRCDSYSKN